MRKSAEVTDDDSWPVGGSRLRPTFRTDSSSDGIGHVPADWETNPGEARPEWDDDWEKVLAAALGITESGPSPFADPDEERPAGLVATPGTAPTTPAPTASAPGAAPAPGAATAAPADFPAATVTPWEGDDILPNRGAARRRLRLFRR